MKRFISILSLIVTIGAYAQQDTTINRVVTVERDFQPAIQSAGKINQTPAVLQHDLHLNPVVYSTYTTPLSVGYNIYPLQASETRFTPQAPLNGIIQAAAGYRNTHFLFNYQIHHQKKMSLDLYANHDAYWGEDALAQSKLGLVVTRHFSGADFYVGLEGKNEAYWYQPILSGAVLWNANAHIGVRSTDKRPIQYRIQTGYTAFIPTHWAVEHHAKSHVDLWWSNTTHSAGLKAYLQNTFYTPTDTLLATSPRHAIRVEPFYEYANKHIRLHVGINLNMNIGTGELLSTVENLSFAPSPNVKFEWNMMDNIFHVYANATGHYGLGSLEEYLGYNRYLNMRQGFAWQTPRDYTPVDAQVGFKIRPAKTLLIDIYGGYAYMHSACNMQAVMQEDALDYQLWNSQYQRWKIGASLHYHYRDIIELNMGGNYYFYQQDPIPSMDPTDPHFQENRVKGTNIFDRPNWDAHARLDVHIDSKWSFYSENYFAGSRWAYVYTYASTSPEAMQLRPIISLNLGGQYAINRWLLVYLQLNDYLNRKNDIFYGYQSQGIHFLAGVKWKF